MFPKRKDCTLSKLRMANPSSFTNTSAVSECLSYPTIADLDSSTADYPILHIITIPEFQSRPSIGFPNRLGSDSLVY